MTDLFKAPEPMPLETYDNYFRRLIAAVEDHVNRVTAGGKG